MQEQGKGKAGSWAETVRGLFSSWYAWVALAALIAGAGGASYLLRGRISDAYGSTQEAVLTSLGIGVVVVAAWIAVFAWAVARKRSSLRRVNLWVGSLVIGAALLGVLSFYEAYDGAAGAFTVDGQVSLGGNAGGEIAGPVAWQGMLRVAGLFVLGAAIATPAGSLFVAAFLGKLTVNLYVFSIVAGKGTYTALRKMYGFKPEERFEARESAARSGRSVTTARRIGKDPRRGQSSDWRAAAAVGAQEGASSSLARLPDPEAGEIMAEADAQGAPMSVPGAAKSGGGIEWEESASGPLDEEEPKPLPLVGKFNKFWSGDTSEPQGQNGYSNGRGPGDRMTDEDKSGGRSLATAASSWRLPPMHLMVDAQEGGISEEEMATTGEMIRRTLGEYGIEVDIGLTNPGPTVTMYGLVPGWVRRYKQVKVTDEHGKPKLNAEGRTISTRVETKTRVKVDSILSREKDLALALKTPSIRIETPVMGESLVGLEVPNPTPALVTLRRVMESDEFLELEPDAKLPIALGQGSDGETVVRDLAKMPHLLIAGSTGSGKSVFVNTLLSCLLMNRTPAEVRLLLVDPKRVELTPYNGIPHLMTPVVVETDQVVSLLKGLIREMLDRYRRFEEMSVRNIEAYNDRIPEGMPYLVVAVDELADLMMTASFEVEQSLCRLAQLGRATGIHLIVATQRPSVDVVTGLIKANFPSRVSFAVTSQIDSRTILDTMGAEKLLGRGDMLYLPVDGSRPERVQGVFVSDREIGDMVKFWQSNPWGPMANVSLHAVGDGDADAPGDVADGDAVARDKMLDKAIELAQRHNKMSTSLLQRRLRIGYPRAARLMDQLEEEGVVGPSDGSKSRDVIIGGV